MAQHQRKPRFDGGCDFLSDPDFRADEPGSQVFWSPAAFAEVIILTSASSAADGAARAPEHWPGEVARREADDGAHVLLETGNARFQLWQRDELSAGSPVTAVIPLDAGTAVRSEATLRLWRLLGRGHAPSPRLCRSRGDRLAASLRALDAHLAGASYRTIAEATFGSQRLGAEPWKTSSLRDVVIRQVRFGRALMGGGYLRLLAPGGSQAGMTP
jgi:hypothetical protein